jgi:hypothetical protein
MPALLAAVSVAATLYTVVVALLLSAADGARTPETSDVVIGALVGLALTSIGALSGWRRADHSREPPTPVGLAPGAPAEDPDATPAVHATADGDRVPAAGTRDSSAAG